ncbi:MAG: tetratricopeptide repeat protein [Magnetococcales bacterium]|nr:tetratricopeptide repeat protein [Magnetococcales bacterium]
MAWYHRIVGWMRANVLVAEIFVGIIIFPIPCLSGSQNDSTLENHSITASPDSDIVSGTGTATPSGPTTEDFNLLLKAQAAYWEKLTPEQQKTIREQLNHLGLPDEAMRSFLAILIENDIPDEIWPKKLAEIAERHQDLLAQIETIPAGENAELDALKREAEAAIAAFDYYRAESVVVRSLNLQQENLRKIARSFAATWASRGETALVRLNYKKAAEHFAQAAKQLPAGSAKKNIAYLEQSADAWFRQGHEYGETEALHRSIQIRQELLSHISPEKEPLDWAVVQGNLGGVLATLGERERDAHFLKQAVSAFKEALKGFTRQDTPLDWAQTQNQLGMVWQNMGGLESGTQSLKLAVDAFNEALKERSQESTPLDWAETQNSLGNALAALGERENSITFLKMAINAFNEALKVYTQTDTPFQWATTLNNLGLTLQELGEQESSTKSLELAVRTFNDALKEFTQQRIPLKWAMTQYNLGNALTHLGKLESGAESLNRAISVFHEALKEYRLERVPFDWAKTQNNLGNALLARFKKDKAPDTLRQAITHYRNALGVFEASKAEFFIQRTGKNLQGAEALLAQCKVSP